MSKLICWCVSSWPSIISLAALPISLTCLGYDQIIIQAHCMFRHHSNSTLLPLCVVKPLNHWFLHTLGYTENQELSWQDLYHHWLFIITDSLSSLTLYHHWRSLSSLTAPYDVIMTTIGCQNDNLWCYQWWQNWHHEHTSFHGGNVERVLTGFHCHDGNGYCLSIAIDLQC